MKNLLLAALISIASGLLLSLTPLDSFLAGSFSSTVYWVTIKILEH